VNEAAATVPLTAGKVTPPVFVLVPAGARTTVPAIVGLTAIFPKFMSTVFEIAIGVITVADVLAVADTWAKVVAVNVTRAKVSAKSFVVAFIVVVLVFVSYFLFEFLLCSVSSFFRSQFISDAVRTFLFGDFCWSGVQPDGRQNYGDFSRLRQNLPIIVFNIAHTCASFMIQSVSAMHLKTQ
jgi:hypothetical protein